jgi:hypothetical protein
MQLSKNQKIALLTLIALADAWVTYQSWRRIYTKLWDKATEPVA